MNIIQKLINLIVYVLLFALMCIICVVQYRRVSNQPLYLEPEFVEYFDEFQKDADKYNVNPKYSGLVTSFTSDISGGTLAYCVPDLSLIKVSKRKWDRLDFESRKLLLYHEWGHCVLKRGHVIDGPFFVLCPSSIMHPYIEPIKACYQQGKNWYDKELFTNPNKQEMIP
jgi:hypothetical protein